jgi:hypothetical protein
MRQIGGSLRIGRGKRVKGEGDGRKKREGKKGIQEEYSFDR